MDHMRFKVVPELSVMLISIGQKFFRKLILGPAP